MSCIKCDRVPVFLVEVPDEVQASCLVHLGVVVGELSLKHGVMDITLQACDAYGPLGADA